MALTEAEYKQLIQVEVGDDGTVQAQINVLWRKHSLRQPIELQYLYVKRNAIELLMGSVWADFSTRLPSRAELLLREKFANLKEMLAMVNAEIAGFVMPILVDVDGSSSVASVQQMEATVPVPGVAGFPDPNDPIYRGDPTAKQLAGGGTPT